MSIRNNTLMCAVLFMLVVTFISCAQLESHYGQAMTSQEITEIASIFKNPKQYQAKTVTLKGKIISECPTGCWFNLKDETGVIYVDLNPSGFAVPQITHKTVKVQGQVVVKRSKAMLIAKGVKIQ